MCGLAETALLKSRYVRGLVGWRVGLGRVAWSGTEYRGIPRGVVRWDGVASGRLGEGKVGERGEE